jgi:hypothetical protein
VIRSTPVKLTPAASELPLGGAFGFELSSADGAATWPVIVRVWTARGESRILVRAGRYYQHGEAIQKATAELAPAAPGALYQVDAADAGSAVLG